MYFVTGSSYILQQPSTARLAKTKADLAKKSSHFYLSCCYVVHFNSNLVFFLKQQAVGILDFFKLRFYFWNDFKICRWLHFSIHWRSTVLTYKQRRQGGRNLFGAWLLYLVFFCKQNVSLFYKQFLMHKVKCHKLQIL